MEGLLGRKRVVVVVVVAFDKARKKRQTDKNTQSHTYTYTHTVHTKPDTEKQLSAICQVNKMIDNDSNVEGGGVFVYNIYLYVLGGGRGGNGQLSQMKFFKGSIV